MSRNTSRLNSNTLAKLEERDLNGEYLKCRSRINKSKNSTYNRKKAEIDMCYILREMEIRRERVESFKTYQSKYQNNFKRSKKY